MNVLNNKIVNHKTNTKEEDLNATVYRPKYETLFSKPINTMEFSV